MLKVKVVRFNSEGRDRVGFVDTLVDSTDLIFVDGALSNETIAMIKKDVDAVSNNKSNKRI